MTAQTMTKSPLRLAYVTQWFAPEDNAISLGIARSLRRRGLRTRVVTGIPNFPTGKVYPGYKAWRFSKEVVDGFHVQRSPLYPSHDRSAMRRAANYLSWALTATISSQRTLRQADVALIYSSPATAAIPAMLGRILSRTPYVLIIEDLWPDSIFATGFVRPGRKAKALKAVADPAVALTYRLASHIAVITPGMKGLLVERGVDPEKISVVYNWIDESTYRPAPADEQLRSSLNIAADAFVVMYAGNLGAAQALDSAITAFAQAGSDAHLVLVGDGVEQPRLRELAAETAPDRIHFLGSRPAAELPGLLAAADVQLVTLRNDPLFSVTMPSKIQSLMACGTPIICAVPGDAARLVDESNAGWSAPAEDVDALAAAIGDAQKSGPDERRARGKHGREFYLRRLSEQVNADRLLEILHRASQKRSRTHAN